MILIGLLDLNIGQRNLDFSLLTPPPPPADLRVQMTQAVPIEALDLLLVVFVFHGGSPDRRSRPAGHG